MFRWWSQHNRFYIYSENFFCVNSFASNWKFPLLPYSQLTFLKGVLTTAGHKISCKALEDLNLQRGKSCVATDSRETFKCLELRRWARAGVRLGMLGSYCLVTLSTDNAWIVNWLLSFSSYWNYFSLSLIRQSCSKLMWKEDYFCPYWLLWGEKMTRAHVTSLYSGGSRQQISGSQSSRHWCSLALWIIFYKGENQSGSFLNERNQWIFFCWVLLDKPS